MTIHSAMRQRQSLQYQLHQQLQKQYRTKIQHHTTTSHHLRLLLLLTVCLYPFASYTFFRAIDGGSHTASSLSSQQHVFLSPLILSLAATTTTTTTTGIGVILMLSASMFATTADGVPVQLRVLSLKRSLVGVAENDSSPETMDVGDSGINAESKNDGGRRNDSESGNINTSGSSSGSHDGGTPNILKRASKSLSAMKSSSNAVTPSANNPGSTLHTGSIGGSFVPLTTPTSMLLPKPTSQGKVGACSNPASLGCSHTLPQNNTADLVVVTAAAAAASSRSPTSVDTGSNGGGDSVGAQSPGVAHPLASGAASRTTGLGSSDTGNGGSGATQAMISIGVVAGIGVLAVGVIVLRRMRGRWRGGGDDREYDGHASDGGRKTKKMTRKSDQHIGLGSFNSTKGGVTESRQPEQFWNP